MERFLLYLDDLDDLCFAVLFAGAQRGRAVARMIAAVAIGLVGIATCFIAQHEPPLGAAIVALLLVLLIYRSATSGQPLTLT